MTFASPRKFWVATDESFISSFTATFCPLGLLLLLIEGHFPQANFHSPGLWLSFHSHFLPPRIVIIICRRFNPPNKKRKSTLGLGERWFRFVFICLGLKYLPVYVKGTSAMRVDIFYLYWPSLTSPNSPFPIFSCRVTSSLLIVQPAC